MKCPICNGDGGDYNAALWKGFGGGEYNQCDYCNGTGKVNIFKYLRCKCILLIENYRIGRGSMKCPICKGEGGIYDMILWNQCGAIEECYWCEGECTVNLFYWIVGHIKAAIIEMKERRKDRRYLKDMKEELKNKREKNNE